MLKVVLQLLMRLRLNLPHGNKTVKILDHAKKFHYREGRNSLLQVFIKKALLKIFVIMKGKHL